MALENGTMDPDNGRRQVRFAFFATLAAIGIGALAGAFIVSLFIDPSSPDLNIPRWAVLLSGSLIIVPLVVILRRRGLPLAETLRLQPVAPSTWRDALLIGFGVSILVDELDRLVAVAFPLPEWVIQGMQFLTYSTPGEALLVVGGAVLAAPLVEELAFRGFFQGQLEAGLGDPTKAVLISSVFFMLMHFNPWWSLQIYLLGMVLGYLAWRTGSIWPSFVVHATNNALATWFANGPEGGPSWYTLGDHVSPPWLLAAAAMAYVGFRSLHVQNPIPVLSES
ncbi:MAG: type II CAAX endopeptidase family protein [Candidatus Neomarinimicrobiota bacterium]